MEISYGRCQANLISYCSASDGSSCQVSDHSATESNGGAMIVGWDATNDCSTDTEVSITYKAHTCADSGNLYITVHVENTNYDTSSVVNAGYTLDGTPYSVTEGGSLWSTFIFENCV